MGRVTSVHVSCGSGFRGVLPHCLSRRRGVLVVTRVSGYWRDTDELGSVGGL